MGRDKDCLGAEFQHDLQQVAAVQPQDRPSIRMDISDGLHVYCKIELPKVANGNWRMLHLQIGESCKAFARSAQERCSA